ncbi:hypothetical protein WA1_42110 [Scytonema hofmannii PCC 7110]|uniref:Metallo-beta-lactamase domain-containing protein n=1 Tax=Scytonema hofmannii PCC 7110 TaxID=128403 RepID=A0A139WV66_9CYAN|nr:MBL fold metallo-hydrolase [Scytonema hofmannii]KYC36319.1 hypothetical protein WA1_42110 [Scytonema hofmannii PCC 7110]
MNKRLEQTIRIALLVMLMIATVVVYSDFFTPQEAIALSSNDICQPTSENAINKYSDDFLPQSNDDPKNGSIKVTSFGTTMLLFDEGETQVMVDGYITRPPFLNYDPSKPWIEQDVQTKNELVDQALSEYAKVDRLKALFVAHSHFDHALDVAYIAKKTGAQLYGSESTRNIGRGGGVPEDKMTLYDPGKEVEVGKFTVTVLRSQHSPPTPGVNDDLGQVIDAPLTQPTMLSNYVEGKSFDFLIKHRDHSEHSILVKPSANFMWCALDQVSPVNVLFLGMATAGSQCQEFRDAFYEQTVGNLKPQLVIPIHWDNFFCPLKPDETLYALDNNDLTAGFDFLKNQLTNHGINFGIMQKGFHSVMLFNDQGDGTRSLRPSQEVSTQAHS